jgi:hypothetical protein
MASGAARAAVVKKIEAAELPPAGDARRDALKQRADVLQQEADALAAELQVGAIAPEALDPSKVEREVLRATNAEGEVWVSKALPEYRYCWVYRDPYNRFGGRFIYAMKALGWEVVKGDAPEAREHEEGPSRERWVADCLLMRIRKDHWNALQLADRKKRLLQQEGIDATLLAEADRRGVRVRDLATDPQLQRMTGMYPDQRSPQKRIASTKDLRREFAKSVARDAMTQALKDGTVPGLAAGAARR